MSLASVDPLVTNPRSWGVALLMLVLSLTFGCQTDSRSKMRTDRPRPNKMPTYQEVVTRYNRNVALIDRLWAKATVKVQYRDNRGKLKKEQGDDSTLMVEVPNRLALAIGKFGLGKPLLWVGCDSERFWLFDLFGKKSVIYGSHRLRSDNRLRNLPLKVRPTDIPRLLGLLPLPLAKGGNPPPPVDWRHGMYVLKTSGANIMVDPTTFLPRQISLFNAQGNMVATSFLSHRMRMTLGKRASEDQPWVHSQIRIEVPSEAFVMTLKLRKLTDARGEGDGRKDRAFRRAFDMAFLAGRAFKIPRDQWIDLDR